MNAHRATSGTTRQRLLRMMRMSVGITSSGRPSPMMRLVTVLAVAANANTGMVMTM